MKNLLEKLNYKGQERIALINVEDSFRTTLSSDLKNVRIDSEIDPRFPYEFIILFVRNSEEVDYYSPGVIHNLVADGILWICYPKKSSKNYKSDVDRDHGWKTLNNSGLHGVRLVSVDEDWSALRFRHVRYIKSISGRFSRN
ncbi:MAG TPA: hypothetical protein VJ963_08890 [Bacteroidales bacterium]|nr:hypothetical protein [Bacteroidales bacterium]